MNNSLQEKKESKLLKLFLSFIASFIVSGCYVYFAISPEGKAYWFGVAIVTSLISSIAVLLLPINKKRVYLPTSSILGFVFYNGYTSYALHANTP